MALELKYASDATVLVDDLVKALSDSKGSAHVAVPVLMPSLPLVDRTKTELANRQGISMGVEFLLPRSFIDRMAQLVGLNDLHPSWQPSGLIWKLVPLLSAMVKEDQHLHLQAACFDIRAQLSLVRDIADRFDQYLYFRPEMIDAWEQNSSWEGLPGSVREDEAWQRKLWQRLSLGMRDHANPASRLQETVKRIYSGDGVLPNSLEVLATGPLPPTLLPLLRAVATRTRVRLRALLPSTEYLSDIRSARSQMRAKQTVDFAWEGNPLLSHLGKQAVDSFRTFEKELVTEGQEYTVISPTEASPTALLGCLQSDIRAARQPQETERHIQLDLDRSVRVHRCHGARREIEILRDELLDAFSNLPNLTASEILILCPDLETYGPLAKAILQEGHPSFPLRLAERRLDQFDPVAQSLQAMLNFVAGRARLSEGLSLLGLPAVANRLELSDTTPETLADCLRSSGITWGLNLNHRRAMDAGDSGTGTWREGLDRLLAGLWFGNNPAASDINARPALPVSGDLGNDPMMSTALDWVERFLSLLENWQLEAPAGQWADRFDEALEEIIASDHIQFQQTTALELITHLRAAEEEHGCAVPLDASAIADWLDYMIGDETRVVTRVGGGMAMGGLKPMRAIPCRVLALVGMQDAMFPRKAKIPSWDLLTAAPKLGDRNPVMDDRQLFLDALMAASDRIVVTATARNIRTNKEEPLSACVDELLRVATVTASNRLEAHRAISDKLIENHPLQPFSADCFVGDRASFDENNLKIARTLQQSATNEFRFEINRPEVLTNSPKGDLELETMTRTLKAPWKTRLASLKLSLPWEDGDPFAMDREPVESSDKLNQWQIMTEVITATLSGKTDFMEERLAGDRLIPYGSLGAILSRKNVELARFLAELALKEAGSQLFPHFLACRQSNPNIIGHINTNAERSLHVHVMAQRTNLKEHLHHLLTPWIHAVFATACGMHIDSLLISRDDGEGARVHRMPPVKPVVAHTVLTKLLYLCQEARERPLPFGPRTSAEIFNARPDERNLAAKARKKWEPSRHGPGEGDHAAARLVWQGQDPFSDTVIDEWRQLAISVFDPLSQWFSKPTTTQTHGGTVA